MIGHEHLWSFVTQAAEQKTLAHAYLFFGPKHVGKRHFADALAAYLLCSGAAPGSLFGGNPDARPCQACDSCKSLSHGAHPDKLVLANAEDEHTISIEQTRAFLTRLTHSPALSSRKVAIIDEAERMTVAAANAFLKHLEEATESTTIILIAHDKPRLLPTIVSRCQLLEFDRVPTSASLAQDPLWHVSSGLPGLYTLYRKSPSLAQQMQDEQARLWTLLDLPAGQRLALLEHTFQSQKKPHARLKQEWDDRLRLWQNALHEALRRGVAEGGGFAAERAGMYVRMYDQFSSLRSNLQRNINIRAHVERIFLVDPN